LGHGVLGLCREYRAIPLKTAPWENFDVA